MPLTGWEKVTRDSEAYKACLAVSTAGGAVIGMATGSIVPGGGTIAGFAGGAFWGFISGYLACPYLAPAIKKKLELGNGLTSLETRSAAEAMSKYANVTEASDAVKLVRIVKETKVDMSKKSVCHSPTAIARNLLVKT